MKLIEQNFSDQSGGLNERPEFAMQGKERQGKGKATQGEATYFPDNNIWN